MRKKIFFQEFVTDGEAKFLTPGNLRTQDHAGIRRGISVSTSNLAPPPLTRHAKIALTLAKPARRPQTLKSVKLYMPNGDEKDYPQVLNHNTENGLLAFRYEQVPGDRTTIKKVITNLPFLMDDETV